MEVAEKPKCNRFTVLIALMALILGLANAFFWYEMHLSLASDAKNSPIPKLESEMVSLKDELKAQKTELSTFDSEFKKIEASAKSILEHASQENIVRFDEVTFKEAESLVRLAEARMVLLQDKDQVLSLLKLADQRLSTITTKSVQNARAAIEKDVQGVIGLQLPDETALFNRLSSLQTMVQMFPFDTPKVVVAPQLQAPTSEKSFGAQLLSLVSIKRHDTIVPKPMNTETSELLKSSVLTDLDAAKMALLRQDDVLYHVALMRAASTLALAQLKSAELGPINTELTQLNSVKLVRAHVSFESIAAVAKGEQS